MISDRVLITAPDFVSEYKNRTGWLKGRRTRTALHIMESDQKKHCLLDTTSGIIIKIMIKIILGIVEVLIYEKASRCVGSY